MITLIFNNRTLGVIWIGNERGELMPLTPKQAKAMRIAKAVPARNISGMVVRVPVEPPPLPVDWTELKPIEPIDLWACYEIELKRFSEPSTGSKVACRFDHRRGNWWTNDAWNTHSLYVETSRESREVSGPRNMR